MAPLDRLFALEMEFHRKLRCEVAGDHHDLAALHTSYALRCGYESLLGRLGHVTAGEIERASERSAPGGDRRDVRAVRDALVGLLNLDR